MSKAAAYAVHCNNTYSTSPSSPANTLHPDPGPPPTAKIAIITCMDARLDPFQMFGLSLGEAHVIRVGGGRAPDAIRSLIASEHVLGTDEVMVVHHTDCGFSKAFSEDMVRKEVGMSVGLSVDWVSFMPIGGPSGVKGSVKDDVEYLRMSPYVRKGARISGWVYETAKGTIEEVICH